ncbi:MAG: flagellar motor switch protein FliG [Calditrichaeota bacterium]|nr:MAG: flagellar motor switch protein FliG [Calditrichota bacterium]
MSAEAAAVSSEAPAATGAAKSAATEKNEKLTGTRKAAILLISLDDETAAEVFKHLSKKEIEKIAMEISALEAVRSSTIDKVMHEFFNLIRAQAFVATGGFEFAQKVLEKAFDTKLAKEMLDKIKSSLQTKGFVILQKADSTQLVNFLIKEHPQTIALILSHLKTEQTAAVLAELPEDLRADVAFRIAKLGKISPQLLREIEEAVETLAESVLSEDLSKTGGAEALAEILNKANKSTEQSILATLEELDPELAMEVKSKMFVFEDLVLIDDRGIQKILKHIDKKDLTLAMKAADESVKEKIFNNMSERASQLLKEELEFMGPVRLKEVEEAQRRIIEVVKQLEEAGEIVIAGRGQEDEIIV